MDNCSVFVVCQPRNTGKLDIGARARHPLDILLSVELHYFFRIFVFPLAVVLVMFIVPQTISQSPPRLFRSHLEEREQLLVDLVL